MKILFLLNMAMDCDNSGPSMHLMLSIIESCCAEGMEVSIVSRSSKKANHPAVNELVRNHSVHQEVIDCDFAEKANIIGRYLNDLKYFRRTGKVIKKLGHQDVVFVQSCVNPAAAVRYAQTASSARIVYNVQDIYTEAAICRGMVSESSIIYKAINFLEKWAYRHSNLVITISEDMRKTIQSQVGCRDKIKVIHNWAYSDECIEIPDKRNEFFRIAGCPKNQLRVVYAGNVGALQDVASLVECASLLSHNENIVFYIVGEGVRLAAVKELASSLSLNNVRFFPRQSQKMAEHVYSFADINVITLAPGVTRAALPSKTAICLSCGKPIVLATDTSSEYARIMAGTNDCEICESGKPEELANAILKIAQARDNYSKDGARRLFASEFSKRVNSKRYASLIRGQGQKRAEQ